MKPVRFQRSRKAGWRKPPGGICCDRSSRWGNPFDWRIYGRLEAVYRFETALINKDLPFDIDVVQRDLRGKPLGCFCPLEEPCHADVLLRYANLPPNEALERQARCYELPSVKDYLLQIIASQLVSDEEDTMLTSAAVCFRLLRNATRTSRRATFESRHRT
jgi:hypothetical protein